METLILAKKLSGGGGGGGSYEFGQLDTTNFTKVYNDEKFGTNGKLASVLDYKSYNTCYNNMLAGWDGNKGATYDVENSIGAYAGYTFDKRYIEEIRLFIGKYTGQTQTLYADIEYLDDSSGWVKLDTVAVNSVDISYPVNCVILPIRKGVCGIRWIHQTPPNKTNGNTITFFGLCLYGKQDTSKLPYIINLSSLVSDGTFTAQEDGLYMAVATCSYQGSSSLTWADGKTPYVSEYQNGDTVTFRYAIGQLEAGDIVTMATTPQQWAANQKSVFLLKNFDIDENIEEVFVEGQRANLNVSYDVPDDSNMHFVFAVTMGRSSTNYRDDTDMSGVTIDYHTDVEVGVNTLDCFFLGRGVDMPTIKLYQYDGGGTLIADYII